MRLGTAVVTAALLWGALSLAPASAAEGVRISLSIPGENPLHNDDGRPVLVAGLWHEISLSLDSPIQDSLTVSASSLDSPDEDMSGHYIWERDEVSDRWSDPLYDFFIIPSLSQSNGQEVLFHVGIDAAANPGTWRLEVIKDGASLAEELLEVRSPKISYGLSSADFTFRAEPFKTAVLSSEDVSQYLRVINQGNVPLLLDVDFDSLKNRLSLVNPSKVAHVYDDKRYYLRLSLDPRPPQIIEVTGTSRLEVTYIVPSPGSSQLVPAFEGTFSLKVIVGRSGYAVRPLGNIIFQTLESLRAEYGSLVTWQVYLTGDQPVSFDVDVMDARLVGVSHEGDPLDLPAVLTPSPMAELPVTLQVEADVPSTEAEVIFTIRLLDTGEVKTFRTSILVGPKPPATLHPSYLWLFASFISASVLALVGYNHWRFNTSPAGRRSSDDRSKRSRRKEKDDPKSGKAKATGKRARPDERRDRKRKDKRNRTSTGGGSSKKKGGG